MYIHNYQIHNVLNEYRKQLTRGPETADRRTGSSQARRDKVDISNNGQRQSIMEQVSADIVDRITKSGARNRFEDAVAAYLGYPAPQGQNSPVKEFTYTLIDEHNRKVTGTFEVQTLKSALGGSDHVNGLPSQPTKPVEPVNAADISHGSE